MWRSNASIISVDCHYSTSIRAKFARLTVWLFFYLNLYSSMSIFICFSLFYTGRVRYKFASFWNRNHALRTLQRAVKNYHAMLAAEKKVITWAFSTTISVASVINFLCYIVDFDLDLPSQRILDASFIPDWGSYLWPIKRMLFCVISLDLFIFSFMITYLTRIVFCLIY